MADNGALLAPGIDMPREPIFDTTAVGEGYKLKHRETKELKVEFASEFLDTYSEFVVGDAKVDRNLQDKHIVTLAREMLGGRFLWEQVNLIVCKCKENGITYRLNGQHTCWGRLVAHDEGLDPKTRTPVQLMKYEAETVQDVRTLYASLDRGKARTHGNVVVSWLAGTQEFEGYSKGTLRLLAHGLGVWKWEDTNTRALHHGDERSLLLLRDHNKLALMVGQIMRGTKPMESRHIHRAPVVGAMFATFNKLQKESQEFWTAVRDGVGLNSKTDPRLALRNMLMTTNLSKSDVAGSENKVLTQEGMYRSCVMAWNAHRAGRELRQIRVNMADNRPEPR